MTLVRIEDVLNNIPTRATTLRKAMEMLPSVHDAVCVVRCKDCRYYAKGTKKENFQGHCVYHSFDGDREPRYVLASDFCSDGKRKV